MPQLKVISLTDDTLVLGSILGSVSSKASREYSLTQAQLDAVSARLITLEKLGLVSYEVGRTPTADDYAFEDWASRPKFEDMPEATYTPDQVDDGKWKRCSNVAGCTVTLPSLAPETQIGFRQEGATAISFSAGAGVTVQVTDGFALETSGQYALVQAVWITSTLVQLVGSLGAA